MKRWFALMLFAMPFAGIAQKLPELKPTAQGMLILPLQLNNPLFDRLTVPLGEVDLSLQIPIVKGFGLGAGAKGQWWEMRERAFSLLATNGSAHRLTWYGKVQFQRYVSEKVFYEFNAKVGYSAWRWDNVDTVCAEVIKQDALHYAFAAGMFVHASDNLAFGVTLGYERDMADFSPAVVCAESFPGFTSTGAPYRFLTVGLGFSTTFQKSKDDGWGNSW
jgi:hypothetical protein